MKYYLLPLFILFFLVNLNGQNEPYPNTSVYNPDPVWISLENGNSSVSLQSYFELNKDELGISKSCDLNILKAWEDDLGFEHLRGQQNFKGIPIEGAILLIHGKNNTTTHVNGQAVKGQFSDNRENITAEDALNVVRDHFEPYNLYYEDPLKEELIKKLKGDENATFYPEISLVYFDKNFSSNANNYSLAWKVDLFIEKEIDHEIVYVDARSGKIIFIEHASAYGCADHSHVDHNIFASSVSPVPTDGMGITRYSGTRPITTDSVGPLHYILHDDTRGNGIETYDMNRGTDVAQAQDFTNDDNFWDLRNGDWDEGAIDAHHGAEMTYDYWLTKHNWDSYDGEGSKMLCYVHWDNNWFNATWNGMFSRYGGVPGLPLTYIDVVAHEFTHGLTGNTSGLIYRNESGALNESFSDIFGTLVEFYALGDSAQWLINSDERPFRNMSDPNAFDDPDTYLGDFWVSGTGDNGGVHTNSGVQNFWFYLLVNGGSGINDYGLPYQVDSIGFEKAAAIAFRNLTTYLTPSSQYFDARFGALQSAADIFGQCSYEVEQVAKAWAAVGVGSPDGKGDIHLIATENPVSSCGLSNSEQLGLTLRYNPTGCDHKLSAGDSLTVGYSVNGGVQVKETMVLTEDLHEGNTLDYTFYTPADLSESGDYGINFFIAHADDNYSINDTLRGIDFKKPIPIENYGVISGRNFKVRDSVLMKTNEHSSIEISRLASRPGTNGFFGFEMTGGDADSLEVVPADESENFELNPEYESNLCFCVDATNWEAMIMSFDIRQTFSARYQELYGIDLPYLISTQLTINGTPFGEQYHPTTYYDDPWKRVELNLDEYAGEYMEVCFRGKHFIDRAHEIELKTGTLGDYTFLDNIRFSDKTFTNSNELMEFPLEIYPNPATSQIFLKGDLPTEDEMVLKIFDISGRLVLQQNIMSSTDQLNSAIDVGGLGRGFYTLVLSGKRFSSVEKLIIE